MGVLTESDMPAFTHHVFICGNVREPGHHRGCCDPEGRQALKEAFKSELRRAGFGAVARANHAGCLDQCEHGPTVVIYPQGIWYGKVTVADVPRIVSRTILGGEILNDLLIPGTCLNNLHCPHRRPTRDRPPAPPSDSADPEREAGRS
jgi:(2Fe-2S) ferredoxin